MNTPNQTYLSVIIPAYNEARRISDTLEKIYAYLSRQPFGWEILVVIDGAQDETLAHVETFAQGKESIRWIDRVENRGKGFTVQEGMLAAIGHYRLFTDADNSTDIAHFDKMKPLLEEGSEIVICTRDPKDVAGAKQAVPQPFSKRLLGNLGNLFIQVMAVPGIWDTQCGFKVFSAGAATQIFSRTLIERWGFDVEALALARKFGYEIAIVPAYWIDDPRTNVRGFSDYLDSLMETCKIRWNLMTGAYDDAKSTSMSLETVVDE